MSIYLITGDGAGKTTSSLGVAMRSLGHGKKVVMIQFMKFWKKTGEYLIQKKLRGFKVYQFGAPHWLKLSMGESEFGGKKFDSGIPGREDRVLALKGLKKAEEIALKDKPHVLILDEVCLGVSAGVLKVEEVMDLLDRIPKEVNVIMTGRHAPKILEDRADFVNEVIVKKYPKQAEAEEGIQY